MNADAPVTFSFGRNWQAFLEHLTEEAIRNARNDIRTWIPDIAGKSVLDVGCGSGLSSLSFLLEGASRIVSFDVDPHSVAATTSLWKKASVT